jgi:hypothetical protein
MNVSGDEFGCDLFNDSGIRLEIITNSMKDIKLYS